MSKQVVYCFGYYDRIGNKDFHEGPIKFSTKDECVESLKREADAIIEKLPKISAFGNSEQILRSLPYRPKDEIKVWVEDKQILITAHYEGWTPESGYYGGYCININSECIKVLQKTIETMVIVSFKEV